jgi:small neutral amino acid transporter SnatA (MarC family)
MDFLVKITGLFVASIGADMILLGIKNYLYFVKGINAY